MADKINSSGYSYGSGTGRKKLKPKRYGAPTGGSVNPDDMAAQVRAEQQLVRQGRQVQRVRTPGDQITSVSVSPGYAKPNKKLKLSPQDEMYVATAARRKRRKSGDAWIG